MSENNKDIRIEDRAKAVVKDIIREAGYEMWDVIFEKEGAMWYLRILFDTPEAIAKPGGENGISSVDCEKITAPINAAIDKEKFVDKIDILEIGSPGLSRKLRSPAHFRACLGQPVCAALRGDKGKTVYKNGVLTDYDEGGGSITIDGEQIMIKKCIKINLSI